jgi:hypothetical protein
MGDCFSQAWRVASRSFRVSYQATRDMNIARDHSFRDAFDFLDCDDFGLPLCQVCDVADQLSCAACDAYFWVRFGV